MFGGFYVVNLFLAVIFDEFLSAVLIGKLDKADADKQKDEEEAGSRWSIRATRKRSKANQPGKALLAEGEERSDGSLASPKGCCSRVRGWVNTVVTSGWFTNTSLGVVLINTLLLCVPYEGMPVDYLNKLELGSTIITGAFIVEMALKLFGLGWKSYWKDGWNVLDGCIVIISFAELIILSFITTDVGAHPVVISFLRILRILRVLRMLRLMRGWNGLYAIINTFSRGFQQMANLFVLILLMVFIFSLIGMQLFGGGFNSSNGFSLEPCPPSQPCPDASLVEKPRMHFDYFYPAMLTSFTLSEQKVASSKWQAVRSTEQVVMLSSAPLSGPK